MKMRYLVAVLVVVAVAVAANGYCLGQRRGPAAAAPPVTRIPENVLQAIVPACFQPQ